MGLKRIVKIKEESQGLVHKKGALRKHQLLVPKKGCLCHGGNTLVTLGIVIKGESRGLVHKRDTLHVLVPKKGTCVFGVENTQCTFITYTC
jgi:hypothetical protein